MNFYDDLVMQTQMNYSRHYPIYASGSTPYQLTDKKPLPYSEQIHRLVQEVKEADCVVVGGASGLSAAGGGDFYYEDNDSYRKYFRPFAEKYHFNGAFAGMMHPWKTREEYWGYGVLNNAPSLSELEAKAKAGEQISLMDLAAAVKAEEKAPKAKKSRAAKTKKPSIRAQLDAAKKEQSKQTPPREKTKELEV